MATYITLLKYTQQGVENIKDGPSRLDEARKGFKAMGAELKEFYLVMGQYDAVLIGEAPNDETAAKLALVFGAKGATRSETMRAFPEAEYRKIIASLP
jgi:uncharacterized protein with GYD domain